MVWHRHTIERDDPPGKKPPSQYTYPGTAVPRAAPGEPGVWPALRRAANPEAAASGSGKASAAAVQRQQSTVSRLSRGLSTDHAVGYRARTNGGRYSPEPASPERGDPRPVDGNLRGFPVDGSHAKVVKLVGADRRREDCGPRADCAVAQAAANLDEGGAVITTLVCIRGIPCIQGIPMDDSK